MTAQVERARIADALDLNRLAELIRLADLAANYWESILLAAQRGDALTVNTHCRQVAAVTREAFALARAIGSEEAET
jgi:hypothetical protein